MDFTLAATTVDTAAEAVSAMISQWGKDCSLELPHTRTECPNCELNVSDGASAGVYKSGGSTPFPSGTVCPVCSGEGYVGSAQSVTIKMRIFGNPSEWENAPAQLPAGSVMTRCAVEHYALLKTASHMTIDNEGYRGRIYELFSDPVDDFGPLASRFIDTFWKLA